MGDPLYRTMINGGFAAMCGAAASHPLDLLKVRGQLQGEGLSGQPKLGPWGIAKQIVHQDGFIGLYSGLTASLMRQAVYSGARFAAYDKIKASVVEPGTGELSLAAKVGSGLGAGAIGSAIANPLDLTLVRMQADGKLPVNERRNYKNVIDGLVRITREEGVVSLWRGCGPTVGRAMIVTASQFAAYDQIKMTMIQSGLPDTPSTHVLGGIFAGFVASFASNPVDVVKSRVMNSNIYNGAVDCTVKTLRNEGPFAFYKGIVATCARTVPYVAVMFVSLEQARAAWRWLDARNAEPEML